MLCKTKSLMVETELSKVVPSIRRISLSGFHDNIFDVLSSKAKSTIISLLSI